MGIPNYIQGLTGLPLQNWFTQISQALNNENFHDVDFTPSIVNLAGSATRTGRYFRFSTFINVTIIINGTSQTVNSYVQNLPFTATDYGIVTVYNSTDLLLVGHGYTNIGTKNMYLPNWNLTSKNVIINGSYKVSGV